jgi:hypothetical protein
MRFVLPIFAAFLCFVGELTAQGPPLPRPALPKWWASRTNATFKAAAARLVVIPWRYDLPQGTLPSNWWWNVEHSLDGRQWSVLFSNVSVIPIISTTNKQEFFRLKGRM